MKEITIENVIKSRNKILFPFQLMCLKEKIKAAKICITAKLIRKRKDANRNFKSKPDSKKFEKQVDRFTSHIDYFKVKYLLTILF